ncbi:MULTISPECIES: metalloregulator ArsR/SmtB family transcription factor [Alcanivorax]|uniref:ArsR/SmtB family transcription factor n=1 Tax=Alcanivorax TaxID=59753 RepID=UPI0025C1D6CE|nr:MULTISPECIES: metalloregulator ArsR/SmtB family transcription factor [Alcanivorax]
MVKHIDQHLDAVFAALADPTRRAMLQQLEQGPRSVGELAEPFAMSFAGASKHVKVLEKAGLIHREVQGRIHHCRLNAAPMAEADAWLKRYRAFWNSKLDALEQALKDGD